MCSAISAAAIQKHANSCCRVEENRTALTHRQFAVQAAAAGGVVIGNKCASFSCFEILLILLTASFT